MDIFIKNATIVNGIGKSIFKANIGIKEDKIVYIGKENFSSKITINANELILTPGFIDTHSHSDFTIIADPQAEGKITQGITTEINGNCGLSAFPMFEETLERRLPELKALGLPKWNSIDEYISLLKNVNPSINFATLCGHGNIRGSVIGYKNVIADKAKLSKMRNLLKKQLFYKVKGLSTGLIYPPGIFANTEELIELAKVLLPKRGVYATHLRSEGERLISALEEAILVGIKTKIPIHISHLKTSGRENWWKIDTVFYLIESAQREGIKITADSYPYIASATDLDVFLPQWIIEGSREEIVSRLKKESVRKEIAKYIKTRGKNFLDSLLISEVAFEKDRHFEGKKLGDITKLENAHNFICDLLIRSDLYVAVIYFGMNEENLIKILSKPYVMIGTDSSSRSTKGITARGKPHPRGFGSFPRFIRKYVLEKGILSLEEAIRKITYLPAKIFKIHKRGVIKEGYYADIVLFDPSEIEDTATFENPFGISRGIKYVIINGKFSVENGLINDIRNGRILL
jgi:N-acyl-D-amino-acid deacylase